MINMQILQIFLIVCSSWLRSSSISGVLAPLIVVMEREPAPCDDLRHKGYPCFGVHKPGKTRNNQYATWVACSRCALRLQYVSKGQWHGQDRQRCPEPNLLRATLEELEKTVPAASCTEAIVQGKLMEIKGKMVQSGVTNNRAVHMTYAEYQERLRKLGYQTSATPPMTQGPMAKASMPLPPHQLSQETPATDTEMSNVMAENAEPRSRLQQAETTVAEAMHRTEVLAKEALKNQDLATMQQAKMEELLKKKEDKEPSKASQSAAPAESPSKESQKSWEKVEPSLVPVDDSDEEAKEKKRTRSQSKGLQFGDSGAASTN